MSRKLWVVCAALMLMLVPVSVSAIDDNNGGYSGDINKDIQLSLNADATLQFMAYANLALELYSVTVDIDIEEQGDYMTVGGLVEAVAKNDQFPEKNFTFNYESDNNATIAGDSLNNFSGNLGLNVAAGNSNTQSNVASYAAGEADMSLTRAQIFSVQKAMLNMTKNDGSANNATIADGVLNNSTGNVGLNVVAGNNNAQTNLTAIATAPARVGMAVAYVQQKSMDNMTCNAPTVKEVVEQAPVSLTLSGTVDFGDTPVTSYQANNFYLDAWEGELHPAGPVIGHLDMDSEIQGAVDNPWKSGVGGIAFETLLPDAVLSGTVSGTAPVVTTVYKWTTNTATISADSLNNMTGNFGINVAAGNNNMQANAFAACYVPTANGGEVTPTPGE
ncbi:MAG: hypothetical protein MUF26_03915 [Syntrophales bacterium]|nr:hypothetical protein [Syntrophales bacterium]